MENASPISNILNILALQNNVLNAFGVSAAVAYLSTASDSIRRPDGGFVPAYLCDASGFKLSHGELITITTIGLQ